MKKILVLGGSGFLGHHLCEALNRLQWRVSVPTRRLPARSIQTLPFVDVIQANVHDENVLLELIQGHDAVINLVAILHGSEKEFQHTHVQLARKIALACAKINTSALSATSASSAQKNPLQQAQGFKASKKPVHLLHISALGAHHEDFKLSPSWYLQSKGEAENILIDICQKSKTPLSILRPSVIFGADDQFINLFASLQKIFPFVPLGCADAVFQPVWVEDVVSAILSCLKTPQDRPSAHAKPHIVELAGPEVLSLKELVHLAGRFIGHERAVLPLSLSLAKMQALVMQYLPGKTLMSLDNVASMQVPNTASGRWPGLKELGISNPRTVSSVFKPKNSTLGVKV